MENREWIKKLNVSEGIVMLPRDMKPSKEDWEKLGFVFSEIPDNDIFYLVNMPEGWEIKLQKDRYCPDGRLDVIDEQKRVRGKLYLEKRSYKKEDFVPYMSLCTRYKVYYRMFSHPNVAVDYEEVFFGDEEHHTIFKRIGSTQLYKDEGVLMVNGEEDCRTNDYDKLYERYSEASDELKKKAELYGDEHFPGWRDVHAYWDDEKILSSGNSK